MKKILFFILIYSGLFQGCSEIESMIKNKDELLTEKEWILSTTAIMNMSNENSDLQLTYHKKSDRLLVFKFNKDGTVSLNEKNKIPFTLKWKWSGEKYLELSLRKRYGRFHILTLTADELTWSKSDLNNLSSTKLETFKHPNSDWLTDEEVEESNKLTTKN